MLKRYLRAIRRAPLHVKLLTVLGLLYLASPIDLIPDFIPVLGQLDDILIAAALIKLLTKYSDGEDLQLPGKLRMKTDKKFEPVD